MSYPNPAAAYREREIGTATPGRLVVLLFDHVLVNLTRAGIAHKNNLIEQRLEAVSKAREGVAELLGSLDAEQGGAIAQQLSGLYTFVLAQLMDAGLHFDAQKVARLTGI